jgi:uncharacterized protein YdaU (DUF1376 family)
MSRAWMPIYWGDYFADTKHLSTIQHGAYLLLIGHYWQHGELPVDELELQKICGMSSYQWRSNCQALAKLFLPNWKHKRIEMELEKSEIIRTKRQISGRIGGLRRTNKSSMTRIVGEAIAKQTGNQSQSKKIDSFFTEPRARAEPPPESGLPTKQASTPEQNPPTENLAVSEALKATVREKGWAKPGTTGPPRQANGLGDGRSLDQIVRDKGWTAEEPPITSKLLA